MPTATLNARIDANEKERFTAISGALGLTPSSAISVFVRKFNEVGGFPFDVRLTAKPLENEETAVEFADSLSKEMIDDAW